MALCGLCKSIPFKNLPALPPSWGANAGEEDLQYFIHIYKDEPYDHGPSLGFPHQKSLEALKASASACVLCSLLCDSIYKLIAVYGEHRKDPVFSYYDRGGLPSTYHLWLNKRIDGGDGFLAFTASQNDRQIYLVAGVGLCVDEEDPLASFIVGRPVEQNAASSKSLKRAVQWVKRCSDTHSDCCGESSSMPLRVLDVDDDSSLGGIRLCESKNLRGNYITLSHCWGNESPFSTQRSTMESRKQGIHFDELPKTFQDAICITRELGVKYLWIDSLCICQDDEGDWERESANMAAVYSNSYLTIAATGAQGNSSGCFISRPIQKYVEFAFTSDEGVKGHIQAFIIPLSKAARYRLTYEMPKEPLTDRGWALQERMLAHRTLHYATDQMYFECNEAFLSEDGIHIIDQHHNIYGPSKAPFIQQELSGSLDSWSNLVWDYGRRKLTKPSDKLPAISGLAKRFEQLLQDDYVVGLWRKTLVENLLWQAVGGGRRCKAADEYRAPSWSWIAVDGIIGMRRRKQWRSIATIVDYHIDVKGQNPYGEVTNGWLRIQAPPLVPLFVSDKLEKDHSTVPRARAIRLRTEHGDSYGNYALFDVIKYDNKEDVALVRNLSLFLLVLVRITGDDKADEKDVWFQGLIITPVSESMSFKRLGVQIFPGSWLRDLESVQNAKESSIVTLI